MLDRIMIMVGLVASYFLKDINFLRLDFEFMNTGVIYPDFLLIFLVYFALRRGEYTGIWVGFFAGLLEDSSIIAFSQSAEAFHPIIGTHSLIYTLIGFTLGKLNRLVDRDSMLPIFVIALLSGIVSRILIWLLVGIIDEFNQSYSIMGPAVYSAIIAPMWFVLLAWIYRFEKEDS